MTFQMKVVGQLIGSFYFKQKTGRPPSVEYATLAWLNVRLNHWPIYVQVTKN